MGIDLDTTTKLLRSEAIRREIRESNLNLEARLAAAATETAAQHFNKPRKRRHIRSDQMEDLVESLILTAFHMHCRNCEFLKNPDFDHRSAFLAKALAVTPSQPYWDDPIWRDYVRGQNPHAFQWAESPLYPRPLEAFPPISYQMGRGVHSQHDTRTLEI